MTESRSTLHQPAPATNSTTIGGRARRSGIEEHATGQVLLLIARREQSRPSSRIVGRAAGGETLGVLQRLHPDTLNRLVITPEDVLRPTESLSSAASQSGHTIEVHGTRTSVPHHAPAASTFPVGRAHVPLTHALQPSHRSGLVEAGINIIVMPVCFASTRAQANSTTFADHARNSSSSTRQHH